jgi:hypothetical protein
MKFKLFFLLGLISFNDWSSATKSQASPNRIASFYIGQTFINEQLALHSKSELVKDLNMTLDPASGKILLRGKLQMPTEEMLAVNLDPKLGVFRFQVSIKPELSKNGFLILEFPLSETYFYPAKSRDPRDRVIVPVQLLSLALASVRGYLAALSGDFSGFDRRTKKLKALITGLDQSIKTQKNEDALEDLRNQRAGLRLQLEAVPIERKQLQDFAKTLDHMMGFTSEKELNFNEELGARKNALIFKIKLAQFMPYLAGVDLAGVRLLHDKKDGNGENYLAIDVESSLINPRAASMVVKHSNRAGLKVAPALVIRLNQALLESEAIVKFEKENIGSKLRDLDIQLEEDGLHVSGKWHALFFNIPFNTVADFTLTSLDTFEISVSDIELAGIDIEFLTTFVLEAMEKRLSNALKGRATFKYIGELADHSRALQVHVDPKTLVPAFPELHLVGVDIRDREFLLKVGHPVDEKVSVSR